MAVAADQLPPAVPCMKCGRTDLGVVVLEIRKRKSQEWCPMCLAQVMEDATGWKMVKTVENYMVSALSAATIRQVREGIRLAIRGEDVEVPGGE